MRQTHSPHSYPESNYDQYLCLKPPLMWWAAVLYLSRAITLPIAAGIGAFAGVDSSALAVVRRLWSADTLGPSVMAAVVVAALLLRAPMAPSLVRWIWARGRVILALSAALDLALSLAAPIRHPQIDDETLVSLALGLVDLYFLLYILCARRVRDTYAEFPPPQPAGK